MPFGIGPIGVATQRHRAATYAILRTRGRVIGLRYVNGSGALRALDGDGVDAEPWLEGVAEWHIGSYREDGRPSEVTLRGKTGRVIQITRYQFLPGGRGAVVDFR